MKLVIPYAGELHGCDRRLIRLAEFLGVPCAVVRADDGWICSPERCDAKSEDCLLVNPDVICKCFNPDTPPSAVTGALIRQFQRMLVYCTRPDPFHNAFLESLTAGRAEVVRCPADATDAVLISGDARDICGAFTGLSIPARNVASDSAFRIPDGRECRKLITVDKDVLFSVITREETEIFLIGGSGVVDLNGEAGDTWFRDTFATFLPHAMALRYMFGDRCWRPTQNCASVIIDDPLLRPNYGFLNFERLLRLMDEHNFATTIAFIPHNFRRNSPQVVEMFQQNAHRFSICFHGNDHTAGEFASEDAMLLNTMLNNAEWRMTAHEKGTGLHCERIMVFPQGRFSIEAMAELRSHNFDAAVNTGSWPYGESQNLTLRELAEPAVLRHAGFPLFLRSYSSDMHEADIAFRVFFGIPVLIVEHHDVFAGPKRLTDAVARVNRIAPGIRWCSAGDAVKRSFLEKQISPGRVHLKTYSRTIRVERQKSVPEEICIEWVSPGASASLDGAYRSGRLCSGYAADDFGVRLAVRLDGLSSDCFSIRDVPRTSNTARFGFRHAARVFVRRRLSEIRDNYISKRPALLAAAETIQKSFQH